MTQPSADRRTTPANGRVAHVSLRGLVEAQRYVEGEAASIGVPLTDLFVALGGRRDRQLLMGDAVTVLDRDRGFAFVQSQKDGYCGYIAEAGLAPPSSPTHWVAAPATHLFTRADLKSPDVASLTLGSCLTITGEEGRFSRTAENLFVPTQHLRVVTDRAADPAAVAESLMGTPYLWGGNSRAGIDCSGLVQAALLACGRPCPGDTDLQEKGLPDAPAGAATLRGDLFYWPGHVAIALDGDRMIHATAFVMGMLIEPIATAFQRIGPPRSIKRP